MSYDFDIRVRAEIVKELIGSTQGLDILDLGCGDGSISLQFKNTANSITLVDVSEKMLKKVSDNIGSKFSKKIIIIKKDVEELEAKNKYDIVISIGLLAHVGSIMDTIQIISKSTKKNGIAIIQITDKNKIISKLLLKYNYILDRVIGKFGYKRNEISFDELLKMCSMFNLKYQNSKCFSIMLPGFIYFFNNSLLYSYHKYVAKSRVLSNFGSDHIVVFRK